MKTNDETRRDNLVLAIKRAGSAAKLAEQTGSAAAYLSQIKMRTPNSKTGVPKQMGDDLARRIEQALGVPAGWMDVDHEKPGEISISMTPFDVNVLPASRGKRAIPVISAIQAGALREITEPYPLGAGFSTVYADDEYSKWAFGLEIEGDSMLPEFKPGDLVIIEPEWEPRPGEYVAAKNGREEATFKKYRQRGFDALGNVIFELVPLNEDYPTIRSDETPLAIIGVMAEHRRKTRRK